jgi:hypothetical protein
MGNQGVEFALSLTLLVQEAQAACPHAGDQERLMSVTLHSGQPLEHLDQWDDFIEGRYREGKSEAEFRVYDAAATPGVAEFYRLNHEGQTVAYVLDKEKKYFSLNKGMKSIWEAAEFLNTLVDDSDPDTDLTQIEHLLQTSEAIRRDNHPRWMVLTGFLHDLGKCLCLYGEPQWGVVGDTFPVGCAWSTSIVFRNTLPSILTGWSLNIRPSMESMSRTADLRMSTCRSATTAISPR